MTRRLLLCLIQLSLPWVVETSRPAEFSMKLQLSHSYDNLSLLEPAWILLALFAFSLDPTQSGLIAAGLVFLVCSFLQRWAMTGCPSRPTNFDGPWTLLLAGAIVGLGISYDASLSLPVFLMMVGCFALYYAVANTPRSTALAYVALLAGLVVAIYFLIQYRYIFHSSKSDLALLLGDLTSGLFPRLGSWSPSSNSVAMLLEGLIPPGIALTLSARSPGGRVVAGIATGLMVLAVVAAASRGAWVALVAAGVLWLASRLRRGLIGLVVAILVTVAAVGGYLTLIKGATLADVPVVGPALYDLFTRPDRLEVYQGSLRLIQDFPLTGIGLGEVFALVYSRYVLLIPHVFLTYSHNLYLTIWLGHGLLGGIGVGWLVVAFGCFVVRESRQGCPSPLFQAAWTGAVVILIHGLFDARQYVDLWTMWPLFILLGLMVSTRTIRVEKKASPARLSQQWKWILLALLTVVCIVGWRPLAAAACANLGAVKQAKAELGHLPDVSQRAHLQAATVNYDRALRLDPANRTARLRLGNLAVAAGRYEEGISHLKVVWQDVPTDPTTCKALGLAYAWVDKVGQAAELLQNSRNIIAELNAWGGWHRSQGRQRVAVSAYRTSLALEPDQPQVRDLLSTMESR